MEYLSADDSRAVSRWRDFMRFRSISGEGVSNGSYRQCVEFLTGLCTEVGLQVETLEPVEGKLIIVATLVGSEPSLGRIVLNSHYDVVPVDREQWCCDPFGAEVLDGYPAAVASGSNSTTAAGPCVYGRGAQDMKCVVIQYLEALRRLLGRGWTPRRTLHLTIVPDEEVGGNDGMCQLLESRQFREMQPIALALDEGLANSDDAYTAFYGERAQWWLMVRAEGPTGHGSRFIRNTAVQKLVGVINKALAFRAEQEAALGWQHAGCKHSQAKQLGDVTTCNVTMLNSGVTCDGGATYSLNVIPTVAEAGFDVRISPNLATSEFRRLLDEWCEGDGLSWRFAPWVSTLEEHHVTSIDREKNPFWGVFEDACGKLGVKLEHEIFPAGTDSQFLRALGVAAVGFSPMRNTPMLLHEHNEALSVATFVEGIGVYERVIEDLCGAPRQLTESTTEEAASTSGSKRQKCEACDT